MSHYYDPNPDTASDPAMTTIQVRGRTYTFLTDHGVFSRGHIDTGTALLLETVLNDMRALDPPLPSPPRILDLACGYGVLGIILKRSYPAYHLTLTDVNARAIVLATQNATTNQVLTADIHHADGLADLELAPFSIIVCNPPIRAGKATVHRLLDEAHTHLMPGGALYTVFGKKQGAESYGRYLADHFAQSDRLARDHGFFVYRSRTKGNLQ